MLPVIVSFDPELPIVTSREVMVGGRTFPADASFPWKALGMDERQLRDFYRSGYVRCEAAPAVVAAQTTQPDAVTPQPSKRSQPRR